MAKNPLEVGYRKEGHSEENNPLLIELQEEPNLHLHLHPYGEEPPRGMPPRGRPLGGTPPRGRAPEKDHMEEKHPGHLKEGHSEENHPLIEFPVEPNHQPTHPTTHQRQTTQR